ncbi:hypothetical protein AYO20_11707 [Fonsecaea nubica]|uniref:Uncharacterized protein n=1 Tax=Fonsecaea nubica TaxID=856822 RepID=A0A178BQ60_9EURO|nr:hypothetical protein AYO20_11707 [Fonsecaea nubica]OAL18773.1 hypothetical protein AYO20_11707 [Fonsecaea nubica]
MAKDVTQSIAVNPTAVFHRSLTKTYPKAVHGDGVYLQDEYGRRVLDGSSGAAVSSVGHNNRKVIEAIVRQAEAMSFAHTSFFTNDPSEELAALIIAKNHGAFSKVMFLTSGSEAVESALKLSRQYHVCNGDPKRNKVIGRQYAYHGNTLGALAAGFNPQRRETFAPFLCDTAFHHVSPCSYSRDAKDGESASEYTKRLLAEWDRKFQELDPCTVAAVIIEPVGGATLGSPPAAEGYLAGLRQLCDKYGALLIYDEAMYGMGRVGTYHAWEALGGIPPDLQAIGKGLAEGYQPLSAVLLNEKVYTTLAEDSVAHPFVSGHTYQAHAIGCAAGLAVQRILTDENHDLLAHVRKMGVVLTRLLRTCLPSEVLKDIRGLGLFQSIEFASVDRSGRPLAKEVSELSFMNGAAVYLCSSAVDAIMLAPPFIISEEQVRELVDVVVKSVRQVLERRVAEEV